MAVGLALVITGCSATPKNGEVIEGDVRMQPVALSTDSGTAQCAARPMLMHRSRSRSEWTATVSAPGTLYAPKDARVIELSCVPAAGGPATVRYLTSEESAEANQGQAATGAMFMLLGGLPALATGVAQRTDVYEFSPAVTVTLPPSAAPDRAAFVESRIAEVENETEAWRELRWSMCEIERSPGEKALDTHCEQDLDRIKDRKAQLLADLNAMQPTQN